VGGFAALAPFTSAAKTAYKLKNGEEVGQDDLAALRESLSFLQRPGTWGSGLESIVSELPGFGVELATTAGIATAGRKGTQVAVKEGLKLLLNAEGRKLAGILARKAMRKNIVGRTIGGLAGEAVRLVPSSLDNIALDFTRRYASRGVYVDQGEDGRLAATLDSSKTEGVGQALKSSAVETYFQNATERLGEFMHYAGLGKVLAKTPGWKQATNLAFVKQLRKLNPTASPTKLGAFLRRASIGNLWEESLEERANDVASAVYEGEEYKLPSLSQVSQELVAFALPGAATAISQYNDERRVQKNRDVAKAAGGIVLNDLSDPVKAADRISKSSGQPISAEEAKAGQDLIGPPQQGDTYRQMDSAQADLDAQASAADQAGDYIKASKLRVLAAAHERAKSAAAEYDLKEAVLAAKDINTAGDTAQQQVQAATDDLSYATAQQNLAATQRASALVKIARGRGDLLTAQEQAALATAPEPAVVNEGADDIITDSAIAEIKSVAPAAARLIRQSETERRAQLSQEQLQAATQAAPAAVNSTQPAPLPAGVSGNAPATGGASPAGPAQGAAEASPAEAAPASGPSFAANADGTQSAEFPSEQEAQAWVKVNRPGVSMAKLLTTGGKTVLTIRPKNAASATASAAPSQTGPSVAAAQPQPAAPTGSASSRSLAQTGTWSAKGKSGKVVSIPASEAKSSQEALERLGAQLPMGDAVDPGSLIPPKQSEQNPKTDGKGEENTATTAKQPESGKKETAPPHRQTLDAAIETQVLRSKHAKAKAAAAHVAPLLDTFGPLFKAVRFAPLSGGSGLSVSDTEHSLTVDIARLTRNMPENTSGEWIAAAFQEEIKHLATLQAVPKEQAEAFWSKLSQSEAGKALQADVIRGYHAAFEARGEALPAADQVPGWKMTHEFLRMLLQGELDAGRVTEAMEVDKSLAADLREFLRNIWNHLVKLVGKLPQDAQSDLSNMLAKAKARLQSLGVLEKAKEAAPAKQEPKQPELAPQPRDITRAEIPQERKFELSQKALREEVDRALEGVTDTSLLNTLKGHHIYLPPKAERGAEWNWLHAIEDRAKGDRTLNPLYAWLKKNVFTDDPSASTLDQTAAAIESEAFGGDEQQARDQSQAQGTLTGDQLGQQILAEWAGLESLIAQQQHEVESLNAQERQAYDFGRDVLLPHTGTMPPVAAADLRNGDVIKAHGTRLRVRVTHDEDGHTTGITVHDISLNGDRYGVQPVQEAATVYVESIEHAPRPSAAPQVEQSDDTPFSGERAKGLQSGERPPAPNGRPSNLDARKHALVRTPEFKASFGDWETLAKRKHLQDSAPYRLDQRFAGLPAGEELRTAAMEYFRSVLKAAAPPITRDGRTVEFTTTGFKKMTRHSADARVLQIVPSLPGLIREATPIFSQANTDASKPNIRAYHHYAVKAALNGDPFYVRLVTRESVDGHVHYDADATSVEALEPNKKGETAPPQPDRKPKPGEDAASLAENRLYQWWHSVNRDSVSKNVDANGEPTAEAIAEFERRTQKANEKEHGLIARLRRQQFGEEEGLQSGARPLPAPSLHSLQPVYAAALGDLSAPHAITPRSGETDPVQWLGHTFANLSPNAPAYFKYGAMFHGRLSKENGNVPRGTFLELVHEENPGHALLELPVTDAEDVQRALAHLKDTLTADRDAIQRELETSEREASQAAADGRLSPAARLATAKDMAKAASVEGRRALVEAARTFDPSAGLGFLTTARAAVASTLRGVEADAHAAATSPLNDLPQPTEGQKQAANYPMGHTTIGGLDITIENPAGSTRSGTDASGKPWSVTMKSHYGYFKGTVGKDGDHIDAFIKVGTPHDYNGPVFVVNQTKADGSFDEHKAIVGVSTPAEAKAEYLQNYAPSWKGLGSLAMFPSVEAFGKWATARRRIGEAKGLQSGEKSKAVPLGLLRPVRPDEALRRLTDQSFTSHRREVIKQLDKLEAEFDKSPEAFASGTRREDLADAQDRYEAAELEQFRRRNAGIFPGDLFVDFAKLANDAGEPSPATAATESGARLRVLFDILKEARPTDADIREGFSYVTHGSLSGDETYAELLKYRARSARQWAEYFNQEDSLSAGERAGVDPDLRAGLDLLAEQIPAADLRAEARNSGSWFEDAMEYESGEAQGVKQRGLLDMAYHERRVSQTHDQWNERARAQVEKNPARVLKELVDDVLTHGLITNPVKVKAAQLLIPDMFRKAVMMGDKQAMRDAEALAWGYDIAGTENARALAARWQPHKTSAEAHREMLAKMIFTPPPAQRAEIESCPTPAQKARRIADLEKELTEAQADLASAKEAAKESGEGKADAESRARAAQAEIGALKQQLTAARAEKDRFERLAEINAERMERIEEELGNLGITLHDLFVSKEVIVRLRGSSLVKRALEPFTEQERRAIRLIFDGKSDRQISKDLGMKRDAVKKLQERCETAMLDVFTGWTKRGFSLADMESLDSAGNRVDLSQVINDDGSLKAGARAVVADPLALARAKEMLRAIMPTAKARNTGALRRFTGDVKASPFGFDPAKPYHAVAVARLIQSVDNNAMDMVYEYWINGLLSGPATHVANIAGNAAQMGLEYTLQRGLEATTNLFLNDASLATFGEFGAMRKAAGWAFSDAVRAMRQAWKSEADLFESEWLNQPVSFGHAPDKAGGARYSVPGGFGRFIRVPCRALLAMDAFFKHLIGRLEASAQAYRIATSEGRTGTDREARIRGLVNTPGSAAWVMAVRQAKELTFQQELPSFLKSLERMKNERSQSTGGAIVKTLLKFIFPFIRTPWNIFAVGLRKTPLGSLNVAARAGTALYQMKNGRPFLDSYPKALLVKHLVEQFIGWAGFSLLYGLAEGDPDDDKKWLLLTGTRSADDRAGEKKMLERTRGGQTMVVIDGKPVFNYGRIEPFATIITTMVDAMRDIKKVKRGARATDMAAAIIGNIKDQTESKTFFQGLDNLFTAFDQLRDPDKAAKHLAEAVIKGVVPNIIRQPLRNIDAYARDTKNAPMIYSAFPMGGLAEPLYDLYGRPVVKTGNPLSRMFLASGTETPREHVGDQALNRFNAANPLETYYPGPDLINRFKNGAGKWVDMTPAEMALQRREGGKNMAAKVAATVSPLEARMPTAQTKDKVEAARRSAFRETRDRMFSGGQRPFIPKRPVSLEEMIFGRQN
jgi:hypothetical protein